MVAAQGDGAGRHREAEGGAAEAQLREALLLSTLPPVVDLVSDDEE